MSSVVATIRTPPSRAFARQRLASSRTGDERPDATAGPPSDVPQHNPAAGQPEKAHGAAAGEHVGPTSRSTCHLRWLLKGWKDATAATGIEEHRIVCMKRRTSARRPVPLSTESEVLANSSFSAVVRHAGTDRTGLLRDRPREVHRPESFRLRTARQADTPAPGSPVPTEPRHSDLAEPVRDRVQERRTSPRTGCEPSRRGQRRPAPPGPRRTGEVAARARRPDRSHRVGFTCTAAKLCNPRRHRRENLQAVRQREHRSPVLVARPKGELSGPWGNRALAAKGARPVH